MADVPDPTARSGGAAVAAERAGRNTVLRAGGDLLGKLASLVLVFVLAREAGPEGVGVYVFAFAWAELTLTPVEMGFDRLLLQRVAEDPRRLPALLGGVVRAKLVRAVPVFAVSLLLLVALDYPGEETAAVAVLLLGVLLDSLGRTVQAGFNAFERGGLTAATIVVQRLVAAAAGIAALAAGLGVLEVLAAYVLGAAVALVVATALLRRRIDATARLRPARRADPELRREVLGFAAFELAAIGIARADVLLLSLLATTAAVGEYGAAYRLLEATLFIPTAIAAATAAMFAYLGPGSDPPVRSVFGRALKAGLGLLLPCGVVLALLAEPVVELLFGDGFGDAVTPLRILAPVVVLLGVTIISVQHMIGRGDTRVIAQAFFAALALNVALNVALVPSLEATGAALGMLGCYLPFAAFVVARSVRLSGRPPVLATFAAPVAAALAMAAVTALLSGLPLLAVVAGLVVYAGTWVLVERRAAPDDLAFVLAKLRLRAPRRSAAAGR